MNKRIGKRIRTKELEKNINIQPFSYYVNVHKYGEIMIFRNIKKG